MSEMDIIDRLFSCSQEIASGTRFEGRLRRKGELYGDGDLKQYTVYSDRGVSSPGITDEEMYRYYRDHGDRKANRSCRA
jgi:hypothetical protein